MPSLSNIVNYGSAVAAPFIGGLLNRNAAGNATGALVNGANTAIGTINAGAAQARTDITGGAGAAGKTLADVYAEQRRLLDPYAAAGGPALDTLRTGTAPGGDFVKPFDANTFDLYKDPGYQWRVQQGQRAIDQGANAGGIRFSGSTLKALSQFNQDSASQEYTAARNRAEQDQQNAYARTMDQANMGLSATGKEVDAGGTYGANLANLETGTGNSLANLSTGTSKSIADLQTDLASAQAAGDVAKAKTITDTISGIMSGVQNVGIGKSLASLVNGGGFSGDIKNLASELQAGFGGAAAGTAGAAGGELSAAGAAGIAALGSAGIGAAGAAGAAGLAGIAGAPTLAALTAPAIADAAAAIGAPTLAAGASPAFLGLGVIPVVGIAAAAALGIGLLWKHSQKHQTANQWVQGTQNDFDKQMAGINENAQLDDQTKTQLKTAAMRDYIAAAMSFAQKGKKQAVVIKQALNTLRQWYNPQQYGVQV